MNNMDELISLLLSEMGKNKKGKLSYDGMDIEYDFNDNGYTLKVVTNGASALIDKFKKDVEKVSDDVFVLACELFNMETDGELNTFAKLIDENGDYGAIRNGIEEFKQCVNAVIAKEMCKLNDMRL